jgi:hypothetical protein
VPIVIATAPDDQEDAREFTSQTIKYLLTEIKDGNKTGWELTTDPETRERYVAGPHLAAREERRFYTLGVGLWKRPDA